MRISINALRNLLLGIAQKLELYLARRSYHCQSDLLGRIDNKNTPNGERNPLLIDIGSILGVDHIICPCDLAVGIRYDGKLEVRL